MRSLIRPWAALAALAIALTSAVLLSPTTATAATCTGAQNVFWAGRGGFNTYRIPALVRAADGTLVAVAEGRRNSPDDYGDIEVVGKRSTDGGCTWGALQRIADNGTDFVGNPNLTLDPATGRLLLISVRQDADYTEGDVVAGTVPAAEARTVWLQTSTDAGASWTSPHEITSSVRAAGWTWWATGGHGTVLATNADHPGRIVIPANYGAPGMQGAAIVYSDDHGTTWHIGATDDHTDGVLNPNETALTELVDGRIYLNARDNGGTDPATRLFTYSLHGGGFYSAPYRPAPWLVAPEVRGALLQDPGLPDGVSCHPLLFTAPDDPDARQHLVIRRSDDGGWTWTDGPLVTDTWAGYTDMTKVDRTHVGVLYETGGTTYRGRIDFQAITLTCP